MRPRFHCPRADSVTNQFFPFRSDTFRSTASRELERVDPPHAGPTQPRREEDASPERAWFQEVYQDVFEAEPAGGQEASSGAGEGVAEEA